MKTRSMLVVCAVALLAAPVAFANDLAVVNTNVISGSYDLEMTLTGDNTPCYVESQHPAAETGMAIEWKMKVTDMNLGGTSGMRNLRVAKAISTFPAPGAVGAEHLVVFLKRPYDGSSNYRIRVMTGTDAGFFATCAEGFFAIPNVAKTVRVEWVVGTGPWTNDARCSVYLDDVLLGQNTTLNFQDYNIDSVRFGAFQLTNPTSGSGHYKIDDVVLTRQ